MLKPLGSHVDLSEESGKQTEFYGYIADLLESDCVNMMKSFTQHGFTSTFQHCLNVSYYNYLLCKLFSLDARSGARAGLLHDLFLYDWHTHKTPPGERNHAFSHAGTALKNARKYFELNEIEEDIIKKHMFPVTPELPKYKETWVIVISDKYCALIETLENISQLFLNIRRLFPKKDYELLK